MDKKYLFGGAMILTLFVLGGVIGITRAATNKQDNQESAATELQNQIATREAAYNALIAEANQQIETLNSQVTAMQEGSSMVDGQKTITAQEAINYARTQLNEEDYLLKIPELASYQDRTVFDVSFASGTVYVDAFSGEILYSSIPVKIDEQQAVTIAGNYLGVTDLSGASVQLVELEGSQFFKVTVSSYVLYIDSFGNITKVQTIQYVSQSSSSGSSSSSYEREHDDDDHEYEHEEEDDDD